MKSNPARLFKGFIEALWNKAIHRETMSNTYEIPYWNKYTLSIEEAAGYFRIGECKLRKIITENLQQILSSGMIIVCKLRKGNLKKSLIVRVQFKE